MNNSSPSSIINTKIQEINIKLAQLQKPDWDKNASPELIKNILDLKDELSILMRANQKYVSTSSFMDLKGLFIKSIPDSFIETISKIGIKKLDVSNNQIIELPNNIGLISSLEHLNVSSNLLQVLPVQIGNLSRLRELIISGNQISKLPDEIGELNNLERLIIGDVTGSNPISSLPSQFGRLTKLKTLFLLNCQIESLPKEMFLLESLSTLELEGNKLSIPPEILEKINEPKKILNYYLSLAQASQKVVSKREATEFTRPLITDKALNEIKILVVGQGSVGKTSIIKRLLDNLFNTIESKTEGIDIRKFNFRIKNNRYRINIWDFGGQEIMHATHQFFLTRRSLYLLVLDARLTQEENRVEYWLKIIQSFGGESPVLIVGNKTDQHPLDIDRTGLQKKYPNIAGILETSAATGAGIEALKAEIAKQVDTLPHVRDLLPETWFTVKSKLEELAKNKNFFTQDEYLSLCDTNDVTDEISQRTLIGFLHDLGVVLHFQDDPRLEALGILNPQWVTNGVYKILNSHELFQNQGKLTLPILNKTLNPPEYPRNKRLFIVDMMKKFELCYDIEPDKSFLIPDLLPKDEPFTGEWDGTLAFQYHYNVLPSSIISRFIVRMNAFVHKTVWRSGVVLKSGGEVPRSGGNNALVKADTEDRKIYIWVSGDVPTRRDFLSAIRMEFDAIHKTIAKIEATEKVPLPNHPKADPADYAFFLQLERDSRDSFPTSIDGKIVDINVRELLNGIRPSKNQAVKVFISYSHQDKSFAKKLAGKLENQDMKVWWDFDSLKGGQDWQKEIERGIKQCDFFLVTLTPDAVTSEWVGNEITYASNAQKTIIPLHLKKCEVPIGLIKKQYIDFEKQTQKAAIKELLGILISART